MTDDRNDGSVPPVPGPAAPPPLAEPPPPAAAAPPPAPAAPPPAPAAAPPAPPVPAPYYPAPPAPAAPAPYYPAPQQARRGAGLWPLFAFLAFLAGVGGTILTLWLTGELWNSRSSSYSNPIYSSGGTTNTATDTAMAPVPPPAPSPAFSAMPTSSTLTGTWGPSCPGSRSEAITFYADGTASGDGESGSWSVSGNYVSLNNGSRTMTVYWEMTGADSARVRQSGESDSRTVYRCQ